MTAHSWHACLENSTDKRGGPGRATIVGLQESQNMTEQLTLFPFSTCYLTTNLRIKPQDLMPLSVLFVTPHM